MCAGPMRNPREGTSVVLRNTTRLYWWCVYCVVVARPLLREVCRAREGGFGSGETSCHDIYPARPITTVSLVANTYCMMDGHCSCADAHLARWAPGSNLAVRVNRPIDDWPAHTAGSHQWFKERLLLNVSKLSISQRSQIKEDTVKPSVPAWAFTLKANTAITWHNDPASLGLETQTRRSP